MKPAFFTGMTRYRSAQTIIELFIVFLLIVSGVAKSSAQSYNIDDVDGQVLFIYGETITLYDSGGPSGDYGGGEDYTVTICTGFQLAGCPPPPEINAIFNFVDIEYAVDCFYDGLTINDVTYCNFNLPPGYGTTAISYVSNPDGCMVVHFYSDSADPFGGFSVNFVADQAATVVEDPLECGSEVDSYIGAAIHGCPSCLYEYGCSDISYYGFEEQYSITATGNVTLTINGDVDFFVYGLFTNIGPNGCPPVTTIGCAIGSETSVSFNADDYPFGIWVIIDSEVQFGGEYHISLSCGSGDLDCSDADPVGCGDVINGSNSFAAGGQNNVNDYCNQQLNHWTGNERVYIYEADFSGQLTVSLTDLNADLDMFVLPECDASNCVDESSESGSQDELISIVVEDGEFYLIVIDGYNGAQSNYTLSLDCQSEECADCGECFTYALWNKGSMTNVICKPKFVDCNVADYPTADHTFSWTVGGIQKSILHKPTLQIETGKKTKVCENVKYKGSPIFQCCWDIEPKAGCGKPPVAFVELGGEWPYYDAVLDASESIDGAKYYWNFGDGTTLFNSGTDPTVEHTYTDGGFKYCTYVENNFGMSVYCKSFGPGAIECTADVNPKFTYTLSGRNITVKDVDASAAHISSYTIDFGDNTSIVNGGTWTNKIHAFAKDSVYEICIRYLTFSGIGLPCQQSGCICFTVKINCCQQAIDQCENINYKFVSNIGGLEYKFTQIAADVEVLSWEIDDIGISNSESNTLNYVFTTPGLHKVCCYFRDPLNGCYFKCCRLISIDNPFNCGNINYRFFEGQGGYRFTLDEPADEVEELTWNVDSPVSQELGTNIQSDLLPIPSGQCRQYVVSARYYDKVCGCYRLCCFRLYLCNPTNCSDVIKTIETSELKTRFYTDEVYPEMQWYINDSLVSTASTYQRWFPTNAHLQVCLYFLDPATENHQVCCTDVTTSVEEDLSLTHVDIYPSPASNELNISIEFLEPTRVGVELINEMGVVVRHAPMGTISSTKFNHRLDIEGLPSGMYFVRVQTELGEFVRKIICF